MPHGFSDADWAAAQEEAKALIVAKAKRRDIISYSDLFSKVTRIRLDPHDPRVSDFLDEISRSEEAAGRGMLSVLVVHKTGDKLPGGGFFKLATELGRDTRDIDKAWLDEMTRVHQVWSRR